MALASPIRPQPVPDVRDLLRRSLPSGEIRVLSTGQTGRFVRVGRFDYLDAADPTLQARGLDSLEAAKLAGWVRHEGGTLYRLTGSGFAVASDTKEAVTAAVDVQPTESRRHRRGGGMAQIFGERWQIAEKLGEGGQGETFLVRDTKTGDDSLYVLKRLKNSKRLPRFEQEIEAIRSLNHPNVLRLIDADTSGPKPYLVSEYCKSGSLEDCKGDILRSDRDSRMGLFAEVCSGMAAVHEADIVHRDIKPSNVFLRDNGTAVVGDFGLCFMNGDERLTETAEAVGARYYMAPELAEGRAEEVTPRADVYSLGKLLYWLMTARVFDRERHRDGKKNLDNYYPMDDAIEHVMLLLDKMIVEEPSGRFNDASELLGQIPNVRRLMRGGYPPLTILPQLCRYCGNGKYEGLPTDPTTMRNFGIGPTGTSELHIFLCGNCGHVLMFRADKSNNRGWLPSRDR
jgi:serine/threonine protein kinase